ncbi:MAG TPA: redoxin family protein [Chthonomonadaceae bacterium]|nr:redoxin family protein [Chthonomonadaceae bacterium]
MRVQKDFGGWLRAAVACVLLGFAVAPARAATPAGKSLAFADIQGRRYDAQLLAANKASVFLFISGQCPISNVYTPRFIALNEKYGKQSVQVFAVYSDRQESLADITRHARERSLSFPVVRDAGAALADQLGATMTPEAVLVDAKGTVRYRGRIDDNPVATHVTVHDLEDAIAAVLADASVKNPEVLAVGCAIRRPAHSAAAAPGAPTYAREVAPILRQKCEGCHRPGEVAPFSLQTYQQASAWASDIKRYTQLHQMPPWKPAHGYGDFRDETRIDLTDAERVTLAKWADTGAALGDPKQIPPPRVFPAGWQLGAPDMVIQPEGAYHLAPDGDDVYRHFVVKTNFTEDTFLSAVEVRPGNRAVVHHVICYVDSNPGPDGKYASEKLEAAAHDGQPGYTAFGGPGFVPTGIMGGWAPGNDAQMLPDGIGIFVPKGSRLSLEVHYHKDGKPEIDLTRLGVHFCRTKVEKRISGLFALNFGFHIPPGDAHHEVTAVSTVPEDEHILVVTPHMHLLGREMKVWAELPDGTIKPLVWVKDWDFNWQNSYVLKEPLAAPKGTRIHVTAYFDNSPQNARNPNHNSPRTVGWGEQTTDEMCIAFISATRDAEHLDVMPSAPKITASAK